MRILLPFLIIQFVELSLSQHKRTFAMDENFICVVKNNCEVCLRLPQCSWCPTENKCFSRVLDADFCKDDSINHEDLGCKCFANYTVIYKDTVMVSSEFWFPLAAFSTCISYFIPVYSCYFWLGLLKDILNMIKIHTVELCSRFHTHLLYYFVS